MSAGAYDLVIEQGAVFNRTIYWTTEGATPVPKDLTGYTAKMQIRESADSVQVLHEMTTDQGDGITITANQGKIALNIPATKSAEFRFLAGVYSLELTPASGAANKIRLLEGKVTVSPEVTR